MAYKTDSLSVSEMIFPKLRYGFMIRYQIFCSFYGMVRELVLFLKQRIYLLWRNRNTSLKKLFMFSLLTSSDVGESPHPNKQIV